MTDGPDTARRQPADESTLEELLAPVLDLDGDAQADALATLCAAQPAHASALRARYAVLQQFGLASEHEVAPLATPEPPRSGRFGPFVIERLLGRGGMGVVYLAEDTELGRRVALKLIRPEFVGSERARARFRREVAAAAKLDHPGICTVYGAGEVDGTPWLSMRYLAGESLDVQLRAARADEYGAWAASTSRGNPTGGRLRPLDLRPSIELVERLGRAVHTAHEAGLVHRDIKPGNVMIAGGRPVLMDFGLARDAECSSAGLTASTDAIGTPAYMAPEQIRGRDIDRRSDVHALGALLYECLTLRPPFPGREREEVYRRILSEPPVDLRQLQPAASRDLATVVHKALAKEPARRYATALALAEDLRRVLAGEPTRARPPGPAARSLAWMRRYRAATAVVAALAVGLLASLWFLLSSVEAKKRFQAIALVAKAREAEAGDPELAFLVLREALDLSPEPEVITALHELFPELQRHQLVHRGAGRFENLMRSPTGRWFVATGDHVRAALIGADGALWGELPVVLPQRPALAFSPDEDRLAAFVRDGEGGRVGIFDLTGAGPRPVATLTDLESTRRPLVTDIAWQGERILLSQREPEGDSWATLHDATTRVILADRIPFPEEHGPHRNCGFLPDGRIVVPGGIWTADGDRRLAALPVDSRVVDIAVYREPSGSDRIAVLTKIGLHVYDGQGTAFVPVRRHSAGPRQEFNQLAVSPAGDALLAGTVDGRIWLLDGSGSLLQTTSTGGRTVWGLSFTPNSEQIVLAEFSGQVSLLDRGGRTRHRWHGNRHAVDAAAIDDAGRRVLTANWNGEVRIWSPEPLPGVPCRLGLPRAALLRLGTNLVAATDAGRVELLEARGRTVASIDLEVTGPLGVFRHLDGESVWILHVETGQLWRWRPEAEAVAGPLAMSPRGVLAHLADGRLLVGHHWRGPAHWFDPETGKTSTQPLAISFVAAPDGGKHAIAIDAAERLLRFTGNGEVAAPLSDPEPKPSMTTALFLTEDGRWAGIGRDDGSVTLWDLAAGRFVARWSGLHHRVRSVAVAPDGRHVAGATSDELAVYVTDRPAPVLSWRSSNEMLHQIAFVDDDTLVSSEDEGGRVRWWRWEERTLRPIMDAIELEPNPERDSRAREIVKWTGESR